jgi:hypothetical protein
VNIEQVAQIYHQATGQTLRTQDEKLVMAFTDALLKVVVPEDWKVAPPIMTAAMVQAMHEAMQSGLPIWPAIVKAMPEPPTDGRTPTATDI